MPFMLIIVGTTAIFCIPLADKDNNAFDYKQGKIIFFHNKMETAVWILIIVVPKCLFLAH